MGQFDFTYELPTNFSSIAMRPEASCKGRMHGNSMGIYIGKNRI